LEVPPRRHPVVIEIEKRAQTFSSSARRLLWTLLIVISVVGLIDWLFRWLWH
jgi:hypothetical protein